MKLQIGSGYVEISGHAAQSQLPITNSQFHEIT